MLEVYNFLKEANVFYLATVDNDKPRVRPFGAINIYNGILYIQTGKVKNVSKQIEKNPFVEICAMKGNEWIRIEAKLVNDDTLEAKESMLEANPMLKGMYSANDNNTQVLYLENAKATISSFTSEPKTIEF